MTIRKCRRWGCTNPTASKGGKLCKPHLDEGRKLSKDMHNYEMKRPYKQLWNK